jgi:predicted acylesterase/phospholipase RssA
MTIAYEAELHLKGSPHFKWPRAFGVTSTRVDARMAARDGRLADLIVAAATIPPVFRLPEWDGKPVIDGGMADQAPMPQPDEGRTLILLTRNYPQMPDASDRLYVWPSEATPADKIDFTDPSKLHETWELGRADGEKFIEHLN